MAEEKDIECHCEDPFNAGERLLLCGQAICWRLCGLIPRPTVVNEDIRIIEVFSEEE
jgi:hypothetical protein